jgi:hypothetical protein
MIKINLDIQKNKYDYFFIIAVQIRVVNSAAQMRERQPSFSYVIKKFNNHVQDIDDSLTYRTHLSHLQY